MASPFSRFIQLMSLAGAAMLACPTMGRAEALAAAGGYASRGKRKTRLHTGPGNGASVSQRAATKVRNRAKHRAACRGAA